MRKYRVSLSDRARQKLLEIYDYLARNNLNPAFCDAFVRRIESYMKNSLSYFPERFPVYRGNTRKAVYPDNKNYLIFFEVRDDLSEVRVLTIANTKQYTEYSGL